MATFSYKQHAGTFHYHGKTKDWNGRGRCDDSQCTQKAEELIEALRKFTKQLPRDGARTTPRIAKRLKLRAVKLEGLGVHMQPVLRVLPIRQYNRVHALAPAA